MEPTARDRRAICVAEREITNNALRVFRRSRGTHRHSGRRSTRHFMTFDDVQNAFSYEATDKSDFSCAIQVAGNFGRCELLMGEDEMDRFLSEAWNGDIFVVAN